MCLLHVTANFVYMCAMQGTAASDDKNWASLSAANAAREDNEAIYEDFTAWSSPMPWGG